MRRTHRPDGNTEEVVKAFESLGCSVWRVNQEVDLIVGWGGLSMLIEVRPEKSKVIPREGRQKRFHDRWTGGVRWVRNLADVSETVSTLRKWHAAITKASCEQIAQEIEKR